MDKPDDPRLGSLVRNGNEGDVVVLGFANDEGVARNGGRVGAAQGPKHFRQFLQKMGTVINPEFRIDLRALRVSDGGDAETGTTLEETHQNLTTLVSSVLSNGAIPFVVGGGNDQSFPNALALINHLEAQTDKRRISVVNIDAHLDVRPLINGQCHSGSPFRQLLEHPVFKERGTFVEFAAQGSQCSAEHVDWLEQQGGRVIWFGSLHDPVAEFTKLLDDLAKDGAAVFVSFDIDAITGADCPGVSAVATQGLTARDSLNMMKIAGKHPAVSLVDVSEMNPVVEGWRTSLGGEHVLLFLARSGRQKEADQPLKDREPKTKLLPKRQPHEEGVGKESVSYCGQNITTFIWEKN